jgi:hypothetical protein
MYAKLENNQIVEYPVLDLRNRFQDQSLPDKLNDDNMPEGYCIVHPSCQPAGLGRYQKAVTAAPTYIESKWVEVWDVVDLNEQEKAVVRQNLSEQVKLERDNLLKSNVDSINSIRWASFSTEVQDSWIKYRQALLDVPQQANFPENVSWPIKP